MLSETKMINSSRDYVTKTWLFIPSNFIPCFTIHIQIKLQCKHISIDAPSQYESFSMLHQQRFCHKLEFNSYKKGFSNICRNY